MCPACGEEHETSYYFLGRCCANETFSFLNIHHRTQGVAQNETTNFVAVCKYHTEISVNFHYMWNALWASLNIAGGIAWWLECWSRPANFPYPAPDC